VIADIGGMEEEMGADNNDRALKTGHLGAVGLDVYENESAYFFADSSSKIICDDSFARLLSFYNVFVR
jgi:D-lactate dehydrogenase